MTRDLLPFPDAMIHRTPSRDPAVEALRLLRTLSLRLVKAIEFADLVRQARSRWGVPPLFFFDSVNVIAPPGFADTPEAMAVARQNPDLAQAWADLSELLDEAFTLAAAHVDVRHTARAMPDLGQRLAKLADVQEKCRQFRDLLSIVDDEVVTVLMPQERRGWRMVVRGIADLGQFHLLFADSIPGPHPDPRLVEACRFDGVDAECNAATIRFQFYRAEALRDDGTLPAGYAGNEHWLWEQQQFGEMPRVKGERLLLAGPPIYPRQWIVGRKFPAVAGELEVIEVFSQDAIAVRRAA